jgi:hypothetical protein
MVAVVHALLGAVIGIIITSGPAVVIVAFFSHYLLDRLPHIDPATFSSKRVHYSWTEFISIISDAVLTVIIGIIFFVSHERWANILLGTIFSMLPDLLIPFEKYALLTPLRRFHNLSHWNAQQAQHWSWYIAGLTMPLMIGAVSTYLLWQSFYY